MNDSSENISPSREFRPTIISQSAAQTTKIIDSQKHNIGIGRVTTRLDLSITDPQTDSASTAANVYVETIKLGLKGKIKYMILSKMTSRFAKLESDNKKPIYVNINSLSKRLGISKEKIHDATHLDQKSNGSGNFNKILSEAFETHALSETKTKAYVIKISLSEKKGTSLTKETLYKIVRQGLALEENETVRHEVGSRLLVVTKIDSEVRISEIFTNVIGLGNYGKVSQAVDLATQEKLVAKESIKEITNGELSDIQNEYNVLRDLNPDGNRVGIQRPPHQLYHITQIPSQQLGYIAPRYEGDLSTLLTYKLSNKQMLDTAEQLLIGLKYCHNNGYMLSDIKPANCLFKQKLSESGEKSFEVVLSDFGGAHKVIDITSLRQLVMSKGYYDEEDILSFQRNFVGGLTGEMPNVAKRLYAHDIYSLGKTFDQIFARFTLDSNPQNDKFRDILGSLISGMKRPANLRDTADQVLDEFQKLRSKNNI